MTIQLRGLTYTPPNTNTPLFSDYSESFEKGKCTAITGPSGSGKTTLLSLLSLMVQPDSGELHLGRWQVGALSSEQRQTLRRTQISMLFQSTRVLTRLTVSEHLNFAAACSGRAVQETRGLELLETLGLAPRISALPSQLSGGERTRLAALLALLKEPRVLLADEPTAALDAKNSEIMMDLLRSAAHQHDATVLVVTHDPMAFEVSDRVVELKKPG